MDRADGERLDREPLERCEGAIELKRGLDGPFAHGGQYPHLLAHQPPQHEPQHLGRARIDPLHVVERHEKRSVASERANDAEERKPEQARVRRQSIGLA
jgi:hypothetical protein